MKKEKVNLGMCIDAGHKMEFVKVMSFGAGSVYITRRCSRCGYEKEVRGSDAQALAAKVLGIIK